jgi:hypothetical protein
VPEPLVCWINDEVDGVRRNDRVRVLAAVFCERLLDLREPRFEKLLRPCIQCGKCADDAGLALLDDELRAGNEKHGRADHRHAQAIQNLPQVTHDRAFEIRDRPGFSKK